MTSKQIEALMIKMAQVVPFLLGVAFTAYNLFSIKVDKFGYYFHDDNQLWLSFGVSFLAIAYVVKHWKEL